MAEKNDRGVSTDNEKLILDVVRKHSHIEQLQWTKDREGLTVSQIPWEGRDEMFRVSDNTCSVLVKHILPHGSQGSCNRGDIEVSALKKFENLAPGCAVKPVFYDKDSNLLCIEELKDYIVYRRSLIDGMGHLDDDAAVKLARDLAIIHRDTHVANIGEAALKELDALFQNTDILNHRQQCLFVSPFLRDDPTNRPSDAIKGRFDWLYGDQEVIQAAANMKKVFLEKKECLVHGDFNTGSILVKDKDSRITNAGYAYVGPCSLDVGVLLANYIFAHYRHMICMEDNDERRVIAYRIVEVCSQSVEEYFRHMTAVVGDTEIYHARFVSEVAGFAGCEIVRRLIGPDKVAEFELTPGAEVDALGAGVRLLKAYHRIHSVGTLLLIALMLA